MDHHRAGGDAYGRRFVLVREAFEAGVESAIAILSRVSMMFGKAQSRIASAGESLELTTIGRIAVIVHQDRANSFDRRAPIIAATKVLTIILSCNIYATVNGLG